MRFLFYRKRGKRSFKSYVHKIFKRIQNVVSTVKVREKFHELKCFISHGFHRFPQMLLLIFIATNARIKIFVLFISADHTIF